MRNTGVKNGEKEFKKNIIVNGEDIKITIVNCGKRI
jgi:hypothetical protein